MFGLVITIIVRMVDGGANAVVVIKKVALAVPDESGKRDNSGATG